MSRTCLITSLLAVFLASGCGALEKLPTPTAAELAAADYGIDTSQAEAERVAREFMANTLRDPYSAQYQFGPVQKGYIHETDLTWSGFESDIIYGYLMFMKVNAKNLMGAYTGFVTYRFFFRDGRYKVWEVTPLGNGLVHLKDLS